jgi:hypothetical protein
MPEQSRGEDARSVEVDEADWLESHQDDAGQLEPEAIEPLEDRLGKAGEADLLESGAEELPRELPEEVPFDAPVADVLEQHQLPTGGEQDEDDWR